VNGRPRHTGLALSRWHVLLREKKLVEEPNEPTILTQYRQQFYGGTAIASELRAPGYVVAVCDSFSSASAASWWSRRRTCSAISYW